MDDIVGVENAIAGAGFQKNPCGKVQSPTPTPSYMLVQILTKELSCFAILLICNISNSLNVISTFRQNVLESTLVNEQSVNLLRNSTFPSISDHQYIAFKLDIIKN